MHSATIRAAARAAAPPSRLALRRPAALSSLASLTPGGGVHGSQTPSSPRRWRNKPLLRVHGEELYFKTGPEAVKLLANEANRRDGAKPLYLAQFESFMASLAPVFDRSPKYAWLAKILLEPERTVSFRVTYIDDWGNARTNRGWRVQYASSLGPYAGGLHFGRHVTADHLKAQAFDATFANALTGQRLGGAAGGSNFDPTLASEPEIQRFCQSFMTELGKYVGPGSDLPGLGVNVGAAEIGYMYGQYKRTAETLSKHGFGMLWGGSVPHPEVFGYSPVAFAANLLAARGDSLKGKRCLVTGSGKVALAVAERLVALGAVPLTLSDSSGHVYEPEGLPAAKLARIATIKAERGARVGRYIVASTTAAYNDPPDIYDVPCDIVFPTAYAGEIDAGAAEKLAARGCGLVVDAGYAPCEPTAIAAFKKLGVTYAPFRATMAAGVSVAWSSKERAILKPDVANAVDAEAARIHDEVVRTATEYNVRGDLHAGANIASFLRVADVMASHGCV
mmetsp:Transcript_33225/g.100141  ORF Transcript_33225/g.100141 Transcript_33225/m.100141 type:complete len:507 (-) Transcript_33225:42-1562(-)